MVPLPQWSIVDFKIYSQHSRMHVRAYNDVPSSSVMIMKSTDLRVMYRATCFSMDIAVGFDRLYLVFCALI